MAFDKDEFAQKAADFADKTGKAITNGVKKGAEYTKEKAPKVGRAFSNFAKELKEVFKSGNKGSGTVYDVEYKEVASSGDADEEVLEKAEESISQPAEENPEEFKD